MMNALDQGANPLFMNPNPDEAREFFARKSRAMTDKRMTGLFPSAATWQSVGLAWKKKGDILF
jgi:hypothetical protein